ncbi:hypothetical protein EON65_23400 [archaeon]|nr:MAG: hypothetical protein EON65_23400 [archaeon]
MNMPARTTVITSVTKRINGNVVALKPSQLLQMAGRAGRRGKDVEGSVVLMKNKYDDVQLAHNILCCKIDSIKSHFRCAYSLSVKLLQTKGMDECQALIQRGFSAYMVQKKVKKR